MTGHRLDSGCHTRTPHKARVCPAQDGESTGSWDSGRKTPGWRDTGPQVRPATRPRAGQPLARTPRGWTRTAARSGGCHDPS